MSILNQNNDITILEQHMQTRNGLNKRAIELLNVRRDCGWYRYLSKILPQ